jgi:hypothetical protein
MTKTKSNRATLAIAAMAAVGLLPACGDLKNNTISVDMVSYASDGSVVLFSVAGIDVYDGRLQKHLRHIAIDGLAEPPGIGELTYSLSGDGTVAAVAYSPNPTISDAAWGMNTRVGVYRISDGVRLNLTEIPDAGAAPYFHSLMDLAISPGGALIYGNTVGSGTEQGRVIDAASGALIWTGDGAWGKPVWSADGTTLFGLNEDPNSGEPTSLDALDGRSGALKWRTNLFDPSTSRGINVGDLALVGDGTSLTGEALDTSEGVCISSSCPASYPIWSSADGSMTDELAGLPQTSGTGYGSNGDSFTCNATGTCAARTSGLTPPQSQTFYVWIYKTDGTTLQELPTPDTNLQGSMAISPDGKFITIADNPGSQGGVNVYSIADGSLVGSVAFPIETF